MRYELTGEQLKIVVDTHGAELVSVVHNGKEQLWQNEDGSWGGHAPILFPVCGHCGLTVDGKDYPLPAHGFAKRREFTFVSREENALCFSLLSDDETTRVYPFAFRFTVRYEIEGNALKVTYAVHNPQDAPLFFSCGAHESYALEGALGDYELVFSTPVPLVHSYHNIDGYLTGETLDLGTRQVLPLPAELLKDDNTLILGHIAARTVRLRKKAGACVATVDFPDFAHLLLWRPKQANMICIEPWGNLPDRLGERTPFASREGVTRVAPYATKTLTHTIRYGEDGRKT